MNASFNNIDLSSLIGITFSIFNNFDFGVRYSHGLIELSNAFYVDIGDGIIKPIEIKDYNQYLEFIVKWNIKNWR